MEFSLKQMGWAIIAIIAVLCVAFIGKLVEVLPANEVMVIQYPSGKLAAFTTPGVYAQWLGSATHYPKRENYDIEKATIRFNDNGTAKITGNVQFDVPTDSETLLAMHSKFSNPETVASKLVAPAVIKAINASGPLMSSREAIAERRNELQHDIDDQMASGVYQTRLRTTSETDPLTKEVKTTLKGEVALDDKGQPLRYEVSPMQQFGVKTFGLTVAALDPDEQVEKQLRQQQDIIMQVQTAIANARKAEQEVITAQKQGEANAATATWKQKVEAATVTTKAQQELDVAVVETKKAEQYKQQQILRADADSEYKKRILVADGALAQKLDAWKFAQHEWAEAFANTKSNLVPTVVTGGSGAQQANAAQQWMEIMGVKAARELSLDMTIPNGAVTAKQ